MNWILSDLLMNLLCFTIIAMETISTTATVTPMTVTITEGKEKNNDRNESFTESGYDRLKEAFTLDQRKILLQVVNNNSMIKMCTINIICIVPICHTCIIVKI
jgi:hypothetical protein